MINDKLYEAAFEYKKCKLWKKIYDSQLFAVKHSDGKIGYCCIMGRGGEYIGISLYHDMSRFPSISDNSEFYFDEMNMGKLENALKQECLALSFQNKDMLDDTDREEALKYCKKNNILLRGKNAYPMFERFKPYCAPGNIEKEEEQLYILEGIEAAIEVSRRLEENTTDEIGLYEGAPYERTIPMLEKRKNGYEWLTTELPPYKDEEYPIANLNDIAIPIKLKKAKSNGREWLCNISLNSAATRDYDGSIYYPFMFLIVDNSDETILGMTVNDSQDDYKKEFTEYFTELIINMGKPRNIIVSNRRTEKFFSQLSVQMGIKVKVVEYSELLDDILCGLSEYLDDTEGLGKMMHELYEMLTDSEKIRLIPDEIFSQFDIIMDEDIIPPDIKKAIQKEMKRRGMLK